MSEVDSWEEEKFREVFENETRLLTRRKENDPSYSIEDLQGILNSFYLMADFNCEGKVQEITLFATIAAYEAFIYEEKRKGVK